MQELIRTALVGTANVSHDAPTLAEIDALLPEGTREQRLLWQAGSVAVHHEAGRLPRTASRPAAAPDETLPETPAAIASVLAAAIANEIPGLGEWLAPRVAQAGCRLPPALLPLVLGKAATLTRWRDALGERGRWLASHNPDWDARLTKFTPSDLDEAALLRTWDEGDTAARADALVALRGIDAASARERLATVLPKEKADARQQFVSAMAANLGMDDEPLLESLLDDRAQTVRAAAASLLARLPASALMRRMTARADACVRWQAATPASGTVARVAAFLGKRTAPALTIDIPDELPKDWARDGIVDATAPGEGRRASWLRQLLSVVPPARWSDAAGAEADALIPLMADSDWAESLLSGCATAACEVGDSAWSAAFLRCALSRSKPPAQLSALILTLWKSSLPAVREGELCRQLALGNVDMAAMLARHLDAPWPPEVVRTFARTFFADDRQRRTPEDLMQRYDLAVLSPVIELYAGWLGSVFAGQPRMLELAREIVTLVQAKQTVIKEMPL
ncbi:DUF5691 domain-containing protein [Burkholderia sp. Ac-20353]|uniref:DUF5691 domain-containing protein n=1 Tax=Burkholderia sp. Ac-20353 TaxID=2703894 RepID=UPI00197B1037|nr:DUF5691 domain-containing protein [Burkholderia sp. Ac-20353]MBN3788135.1 hypothetical protein [Burkholderia sp. Ac-20353]